MSDSPIPSPTPVLARPAQPVAVRQVVEPTVVEPQIVEPTVVEPQVEPAFTPPPPPPAAPQLTAQLHAQDQAAEPAPQKRSFRQFDDIYITRFAGIITYVHVLKDARLDATIGNYHSQPQDDHWVVQALTEAARLSRTRSTIRIHTTESEITSAIRDLRHKSDEYGELARSLAKSGKSFVLARPERESPIWRDLMKLMKDGKMPTPSPLVTYVVHTAAITDYERVYTGVVMVGLGTIVVHATASTGDDLIDAELNMMEWVLQVGGGGGRIDVHHSTDGARRIWEQADHLAKQEGTHDLGRSGTRLRSLAREAFRIRTQIQAARAPNPLFDRFARFAASTCWADGNIL
ncbi:hypothetical protein [Deinococcus indicus]|uniref:hypothetical protein n=1 Tax=Deinococcus indicus TaxID=223556 RepID=UPI001FD441D0|nr:hypothetical protein [Deinococcus indicus]